MYIYLDTNVYLSFYDFTDDTINALSDLRTLIARMGATLLLPKQTEDEFYRNREARLLTVMRQIKEHKPFARLPELCKSYDQFDTMKVLSRDIDRAKSEMISQIETDIRNNNLLADRIIQQLFSFATKIPITEAVFSSAERRLAVGKPPQKNDRKIGDALNWESILSSTPNQSDIHLVSNDKDYMGTYFTEEFNTYLDREWRERKSSCVHFYRSVSKFFRTNFPDLELGSSFDMYHLITELRRSRNFARTHSIVSELGNFTQFTNFEAEKILDACLNNPQVRWIISDSDVRSLIEMLLGDASLHIDPELHEMVAEEINDLDERRQEIADEIEDAEFDTLLR